MLEKFARERYLMKRDNEDIFVLVPRRSTLFGSGRQGEPKATALRGSLRTRSVLPWLHELLADGQAQSGAVGQTAVSGSIETPVDVLRVIPAMVLDSEPNLLPNARPHRNGALDRE
ncbi:MAG: hypothetical protein IPH53_12670 [Flavobacteriales bacterium]|nr:hypothetical protein [Flavobacteriales bacterium]